MMKKIAIVSYYHTESSLCLAKHIAQQGIHVDYYFFSLLRENSQPGIEYRQAKLCLGTQQLTENDIPEMYSYVGDAPINFFVIVRLGGMWRRLTWLTWLITKIAMLRIKSKNYDTINVVGQVAPVLRIHNSLKGENVIHTIHEVGSHQNNIPTTPLLNAIIRDHNKVIFHSQSTCDRFRAIGDTSHNKAKIIPFGKFETNLLYERDENLKLEIPKDKIVFLFYGYIKPYKGLDLLIAAMERLKSLSDKFVLIVAGEGNDPHLEKTNQMRNCIVINRFLSNNELMKLNRIASVVLMPYHSASQTGIAPTCFMFGNPIIATNVGALSEVIENGGNGILVEPEDVEAYANAMKQMVENPHLIKKLSNGASKFGDGDKYDWKVIAKKTIEFYYN